MDYLSRQHAYRALGWRQRLQSCLKFAVQAAFFRHADVLLVELDHVREGLLHHSLASPSSVRVVRNCLSSLYLSP